MRFVVTFALLTGAAFGATLTDPDPSQIDQIIAKFAAKEAAFAKARSNYTYRQTAKVMTLDDGGGVTGKWEEVTDIIFLARRRAHRKGGLRAAQHAHRDLARSGRHSGSSPGAALRAHHR